MRLPFTWHQALSIFLWLIALHSFAVGIGLIVMPGSFMEQMGYGSCTERFFRTQGGVFHIAMAVGYALAARNAKKFECLVIFSILVKLLATVFLFSYALFVKSLAVIALSGLFDLFMGLVLLYLYRRTKQEVPHEV